MTIYALDPGTERSAVVTLIDRDIAHAHIASNAKMLDWLRAMGAVSDAHLVIEQIRSYGMPLGAETLDTVFWSGRFVEAWGGSWTQIPRLTVKLALCKSPRATDSNIRQAIVDAYGGKERAIGRKANPGPLHGIRKDLWQALAVGLTYQLTLNQGSDLSMAGSVPNAKS